MLHFLRLHDKAKAGGASSAAISALKSHPAPAFDLPLRQPPAALPTRHKSTPAIISRNHYSPSPA